MPSVPTIGLHEQETLCRVAALCMFAIRYLATATGGCSFCHTSTSGWREYKGLILGRWPKNIRLVGKKMGELI